ncbi:granulin-like isoform X5 [Porites lutea]|uniref:granulin-like isoform X5 n=1 Tax=Porites lutea TaxID=51062 RepID=UPI003CC609E1
MLAPNVKTVAVILVMLVPFVCAYVDKAGNNVGFIKCPDGGLCGNGQTCCYLASHRSYGCCDKPRAVCCRGKLDGMCCSRGYRCNAAELRCDPRVIKTKPTDLDATEIRSSYRELLPDQRFDFE